MIFLKSAAQETQNQSNPTRGGFCGQPFSMGCISFLKFCMLGSFNWVRAVTIDVPCEHCAHLTELYKRKGFLYQLDK